MSRGEAFQAEQRASVKAQRRECACPVKKGGARMSQKEGRGVLAGMLCAFL